jgi:hypothetical protein
MIRSMMIGWAWHVECMGEIINAYKMLVIKPERKRPLGRSRHRWEDNINVGLREIGWKDVDECICLRI